MQKQANPASTVMGTHTQEISHAAEESVLSKREAPSTNESGLYLACSREDWDNAIFFCYDSAAICLVSRGCFH
jgi:hypothetical protein